MAAILLYSIATQSLKRARISMHRCGSTKDVLVRWCGGNTRDYCTMYIVHSFNRENPGNCCINAGT